MRVDILGTKYTIAEKKEHEDKILKDCNGYCDYTIKLIVVCQNEPSPETLKDLENLRKKTLRHEIVHAFLFESGLGGSWEHPPHGQEETVVDWIALQFPKLLKAFESVGAL